MTEEIVAKFEEKQILEFWDNSLVVLQSLCFHILAFPKATRRL